MLKVGINKRGKSNFSKQTNLKRLSIDVWEKMATNGNIDYKYIDLTGDWDDTVEKLNRGDIDILIGPYIQNFKRKKDVDFTLPWYMATYSIASYKKPLLFKVLSLLGKFALIYVLFMIFSFLQIGFTNTNIARI